MDLGDGIFLAESEVELNAIRAQGAGGQNVNKVATAIHLRFDIRASSLPDYLKNRLLGLNDQRVSDSGIIVIKAQQFRTQEKNRQEALERLAELILSVRQTPRKRIATRPGRVANKRRLEHKNQQSQKKKLRQNPPDY